MFHSDEEFLKFSPAEWISYRLEIVTQHYSADLPGVVNIHLFIDNEHNLLVT